MGALLNRRRYMGGGSADEIIMTSITNPEVLAVCYAQGWCADENYMTKSEAEAVTSIGTAFVGNTNITHFEEFEYFGVTSLDRPNNQSGGFCNCSALTSIAIPTTLSAVAYQSFQNCTSLQKVIIKDLSKWCSIYFSYAFDNPLYYAHYIYEDSDTLMQVSIPTDISILKRQCFTGCYNLTGDIVIPENITSLEPGVFNSCANITSITFPSSITVLPESIIASCPSISGIFEVREGITEVGRTWCWGCSGITRLVLPSTINKIGANGLTTDWRIRNREIIIKATTPPNYNNATAYIYEETRIYVPDESVEDYKTSQYWSNLANNIRPMSDLIIVAKYNVVTTSQATRLTYNSTTAAMFTEMYIDGDKLPSVVDSYKFSSTGVHTVKYMLADITTIGENAFWQCRQMTDITIPNSVTSLGENAFRFCTSLVNIVFNSTLTSIGQECFYSASSLSTVTIPSSVVSLGMGAFSRCTNLTDITLSQNITEISASVFYGCTSLASIELHEGITGIGASAFKYCSSLTSIVIPNTVTMIWGYSFQHCTSLISVTVNSATPPGISASSVFDNNAEGRKIYVPAQSVETYKSTTGWSTYVNDIEAIPN